MIFGFAILATALLLSAVAAYYSVAGLVAIFSAATIPVIIMGGSLELGKIVATVWLHNNWRRAPWLFKAYLIPAVVFLMLLTSMGIFGFLSKAHLDQAVVSGDSTTKIAIYDEKIKSARDNIDTNRRALKQMDDAVDQLMSRTSDEQGATRAANLRRTQQAERNRLQAEIAREQTRIQQLSEERAPVAAEVRKVEAEVGPIKYIAALIYGDTADATMLERAVRFVIIMIVLVFDPLALTLILAANKQFEWARQGRGGWVHEQDDFQTELDKKRAVAKALDTGGDLPAEHTRTVHPLQPGPESVAPEPPQPAPVAYKVLDDADDEIAVGSSPPTADPGWQAAEIVPGPETESSAAMSDRAAMRAWKANNPNGSLKQERRRFERGEISELPWATSTKTTFGIEFPQKANRGDTHVNTRVMPHSVFKWTGIEWIAVDKLSADNYTFDEAYLRYLITKLESGEYDPELLNDQEREQIAQYLSVARG